MKKLGLIIYDFDGVLTDNRVFVSDEGRESVSCNRSDGLWMAKIREAGIPQMILSTETNPVVGHRAKKLGLEVLQGQKDKKKALLEISLQKGIPLEKLCYVGNDINDLECLKSVGYPLAPQDSHPSVLNIAQVLPVKGGAGIVEFVYKWLTQEAAQTSYAHLASSENTGTAQRIFSKSIGVKQSILENAQTLAFIEKMGLVAYETIRTGKKIFFAGNGGSFADAMHLAAELVSRLNFDRAALPSIALGCSNSNISAIGNDYGYEHVFEREIVALASPGDLFFALSTSGNSPNILRAVEAALERKVQVFGWSGESGGKLAKLCETFKVPATNTARIQEVHIMVGHIVCEIIENKMFGAQTLSSQKPEPELRQSV